jgi:hypothetical protein
MFISLADVEIGLVEKLINYIYEGETQVTMEEVL